MLRVFTESLIDSSNSVVLSRDDSVSSRIRQSAGVKSPNDHKEGHIRSWVYAVGHKAVDKACETVDRAAETVDRAKEAVKSHVHVSHESKTQITGVLFAKFQPEHDRVEVDVDPKSSAPNQFKKEFVKIRDNLKMQQTCSLM